MQHTFTEVMLVSNMLIRGIIIYITVITTVRLMGKRQIGELQPSELVTTFLLSEVASMPLQNKDISLFTCLVLIFMIVSLEIIFSVIAVKSDKFRRLLQGSSVLVIKDGKLLQKKLGEIRYSIDDLIEGLRLKDVFDISQVKYAYVETNGSLSIELKEKHRPVTPDDLRLTVPEQPITCLVISDGHAVEENFQLCGMTRQRLDKQLKKAGYEMKDIFIMTADKGGRYNIIPKETRQ